MRATRPCSATLRLAARQHLDLAPAEADDTDAQAPCRQPLWRRSGRRSAGTGSRSAAQYSRSCAVKRRSRAAGRRSSKPPHAGDLERIDAHALRYRHARIHRARRLSLHRDGLGQVARLVDVEPLDAGDVVGEQLQRAPRPGSAPRSGSPAGTQSTSSASSHDVAVTLAGHGDHVGAARPHLLDVARRAWRRRGCRWPPRPPATPRRAGRWGRASSRRPRRPRSGCS